VKARKSLDLLLPQLMKKSKEAETLFEKFLNKNKIPYYYISQYQEKYSKELSEKNISRPDYIIHTEKAIYYVDVKGRKKMNFGEIDEKRFYLNQNELIRLYNFQKNLNECVWISFIELKNPQFFYASILELYEYYKNTLESIGRDFFEFLEEHTNDAFKELYDELWIFIPEKILYSQLSFERGFYKEPDKVFFKQEAEYHKLKWRNKIEEHLLFNNNTINMLDLMHYKKP
jgi:hypothetical protein